MFVATSTIKNSCQGKWVYSYYGIAFDGKGMWSFGNDYARNFIVFDVYNSSSSRANNRIFAQVILLELLEALVHHKKSLVLILVKETKYFA